MHSKILDYVSERSLTGVTPKSVLKTTGLALIVEIRACTLQYQDRLSLGAVRITHIYAKGEIKQKPDYDNRCERAGELRGSEWLQEE